MTQKVVKKIKALQATTIRYSSRVQRHGPRAEGENATAFSRSAAKYYVALRKLAAK